MSAAANAPVSAPVSTKDLAYVLPLTFGDAGDAVSDLQSRLVRLGFLSSDEATGCFDVPTGHAVSLFQRQRGLRCDGVCGSDTWAAVVEAGYSLGDRILYRRAPMFHGDDVAELQRRLSELGFDPGGVDGIFGDQTSEAVSEFQHNVGLVVDGLCGHKTIAELTRLTVRRGGGDLVSSVRERLKASARGASLFGRKIAVGERGGFQKGVTALCRALADAGAESLPLHHPDESEQAASANRAEVDCYVGLHLVPEQLGVRTLYYRGYRYESETSRLLADLTSTEIGARLELGDHRTEGMAVPILRETRMPAIVVELGDPGLIVMKVTEVAQAIVTALEQWLMVDWETRGSSTS